MASSSEIDFMLPAHGIAGKKTSISADNYEIFDYCSEFEDADLADF